MTKLPCRAPVLPADDRNGGRAHPTVDARNRRMNLLESRGRGESRVARLLFRDVLRF